MSQPQKNKFPIINISSKDPGGSPTGANVKVSVDGIPMPYVSFIKVECHARRITKVVMEMYAHVEVDVIGDLSTKIIPLRSQNKSE